MSRDGAAQMALADAVRRLEGVGVPDWPLLRRLDHEVRPHWFLTWGARPVDVKRLCPVRHAYLATPYSREVIGTDGRWCAERSAEMGRLAAVDVGRLAAVDVTAVSPIVLADAAVRSGGAVPLDPLDDGFWARWCLPLMVPCGAIVVPDIPGWQRSRGVWREVLWGLRYGVQVCVEAEGV